MKIDEETGAFICTKCGATIKVRRVNRFHGYPTKALFRCPTKKLDVNKQEVDCTGGFPQLINGKGILKLPIKTREYYKLKKPGEKLKKPKKKLFRKK